MIQTGPFGSQLHAHDYRPTGTPVVPTEAIGRRRIKRIPLPCVDDDVADRLSRHRLQRGDILFARRGAQATGLSAIIEENHSGSLCGTGAILMRVADSKRINPTFLSFALASPGAMQWLREHAVGAVMPNLNADVIRRLPIPLPPRGEQDAIAHILGTLDDKIELNRRMNETLEEMARALFKSWFVDFDPVHAKAAGKKPFGMDEATAALFPDEFEESELGAIPKGWEVVPLERVTSYLRRGIQPKYCDDGVPVINQKCIRNGRVNFASARQHDSTHRSTKGRELEPLDVLVNSTGVGTLGRVAVLPPDAGTVICDSHVTVVRASQEVASVWLALQLRELEPRIEHMGQGSTGQTELSRAHLCALLVVLPPVPVQRQFAKVVRLFMDRMWQAERESETLASLRDTLLPKLLSGEVSVAQVEHGVEASA